MRILIGRRHEHFDVAADHVSAGIAEHPFACLIEQTHLTDTVDDYDAINRRLDHRMKPSVVFGHADRIFPLDVKTYAGVSKITSEKQ